MWSHAAREVQAILQDSKAANLEASSDDFWVMAAALRDYVEAEGEGCVPIEVLPLPSLTSP